MGPHIPHFSPVYTQKMGSAPETRISTGLSRVLKKTGGEQVGIEKVGSKWGVMSDR